jgi:hydroxyacylglutathione hydrolase
MILESICVGPLEVNCYVLASREKGKAIIIDPGAEARRIKQVLKKHQLEPALVINTHGHYDHIGADDSFGVPVYIHEIDSQLLKDAELNLSKMFALPFEVKSEVKALQEGQLIDCEELKLQVLHIPGHTPGGVALRLLKPVDNIVFTGDTLFCQGIGRSDIPEGDGDLLVKAIKEKLLILPEDTVVYPGHGPSSTIGDEKRGNPFLS